MLVECQRRNICGKVTNMHDEYFANPKLDASDVPYLEGDYFPGEAENIIAELNKGKGKKSSKSKKKKSDNAASDDTSAVGETSGADEVMVKLGEIIAPMKESFIVAYLNCEDALEENMVVPKAIMEHRAKVAEEENASGKSSDSSSKRKRDADGNVKSDSVSVDKDGSPIKIIDDDVEELDCEFLNNRQAFLNLCRGNHYQFDELRRAKHTSMMVLWHLHNRGAPKFVPRYSLAVLVARRSSRDIAGTAMPVQILTFAANATRIPTPIEARVRTRWRRSPSRVAVPTITAAAASPSTSVGSGSETFSSTSSSSSMPPGATLLPALRRIAQR